MKGFLAFFFFFFFHLVQAEQDGEMSVPLSGHPQWLRMLEAGCVLQAHSTERLLEAGVQCTIGGP